MGRETLNINYITQQFSIGGIFASQETFSNLWRHFWLLRWLSWLRQGYYWLLLGRGQACHWMFYSSIMHKTALPCAPPPKNYLIQTVNNAEAENPGVILWLSNSTSRCLRKQIFLQCSNYTQRCQSILFILMRTEDLNALQQIIKLKHGTSIFSHEKSYYKFI